MKNTKQDIPSTYRQLYRLENLDDWKVHHDDIDIRDYDVKTADGKTIGEVENLLVDLEDKKVRYVEVELEDDNLRLNDNSVVSYKERDGDRIIIIPVGLVEVDEDGECVSIEGLTSNDFREYPYYKRATAVTPYHEQSVYDYIVSAPGLQRVTANNEEETVVSNVDFEHGKYDSPFFRDSKYRQSALRTSMTGIV